jgi:hypothetical protein
MKTLFLGPGTRYPPVRTTVVEMICWRKDLKLIREIA